MKKMLLIFTLAIVGGGCHQDSLTVTKTTMPDRMHIEHTQPIGQVVIIPHDELFTEEGMASLRNSLCDQNYVLQIKPISQHAGSVPLRVFSKDGNNTGWSTAISQIAFHTLDTVWNTILLYDVDTVEICFTSTNNVAFIQPLQFSEEIEFQVRFYNVSGSIPTAAETILWEVNELEYYTMYPAASGNCSNLNPQYCCDYDFSADLPGSGTAEGVMEFRFAWDGGAGVFQLDVPPLNSNEYEPTYCGPILISWYTDNHATTEGEGTFEFNCDNTEYDFKISENANVHGLLMDPDGRMCKLTY